MKVLYYMPELKYQQSSLKEFCDEHTITYYNVYENKDETFNYKTAHFMMYTKVLDLCEKERFDKLVIFGRPMPEYIYDELSVRPNLKTQIIFKVEENEENNYPARKNVLNKLSNFKNIVMIKGE